MDEIERMETALRAAIAEHRVELHRRLKAEAQGFELRFLLARLGFAADELDALAGAAAASELAAELRATVRQRLAGEVTRLLRLARAGSPAYDINRHIAVRRALCWIEGGPTLIDPTAPDVRRSGWVLNGRFRGAARRKPIGPGTEGTPRLRKADDPARHPPSA